MQIKSWKDCTRKKVLEKEIEENFLKLIKGIYKTPHQTLKKSHNKSPFANKTSDWKCKWHHGEAERALAGHGDLGRQLGALVARTVKPRLDPRVLSNGLDEWFLRYHLPIHTQHTCTIQFRNSTNKALQRLIGPRSEEAAVWGWICLVGHTPSGKMANGHFLFLLALPLFMNPLIGVHLCPKCTTSNFQELICEKKWCVDTNHYFSPFFSFLKKIL